MKIAFIGLPQSGKSTLFSAVTGIPFDPYAAPQIHAAVVHVPDPRLTYLTKLYNPKKVTEATVEFLDVPGHSLEDSKGRDEWRKVLPHVRQADGLVLVVRDFKSADVAMYRNRIDAKADFDELRAELLFADLESVVTRIEKIEKSLKKPTATHDAEKHELALLQKCREALESDRPLSTVVHTDDDRRQVSSFAFLTEKPLVCIRNVSDDQAATAQSIQAEHVAASIALCASIEAEIAGLEPADREAFLKELGLTASARDRLIQSCYAAMGLISFLTMGPDEVRAWTIKKGDTASEAAGKIHTDLSRGFVRAETVAYDDLVTHVDMKGARAAGKVRKEGKGYIVVDGDILNILANA